MHLLGEARAEVGELGEAHEQRRELGEDDVAGDEDVVELPHGVLVRDGRAVVAGLGEDAREAVVVGRRPVLGHHAAEDGEDRVARVEPAPEGGAGKRDRQAAEAARDSIEAGEQRVEIRAGLDARHVPRDDGKGQALELGRGAHLVARCPVGERLLHGGLHRGDVAGQCLPREPGEHLALAGPVLGAVEQRQAATAEQLLDVARHRPFAQRPPLVEEHARDARAREDDGRPPEQVRAEDGPVPCDAAGDERERVLQEGERLAKQGEGPVAGRQRLVGGIAGHDVPPR